MIFSLHRNYILFPERMVENYIDKVYSPSSTDSFFTIRTSRRTSVLTTSESDFVWPTDNCAWLTDNCVWHDFTYNSTESDFSFSPSSPKWLCKFLNTHSQKMIRNYFQGILNNLYICVLAKSTIFVNIYWVKIILHERLFLVIVLWINHGFINSSLNQLKVIIQWQTIIVV